MEEFKHVEGPVRTRTWKVQAVTETLDVVEMEMDAFTSEFRFHTGPRVIRVMTLPGCYRYSCDRHRCRTRPCGHQRHVRRITEGPGKELAVRGNAWVHKSKTGRPSLPLTESRGGIYGTSERTFASPPITKLEEA